MLPHLRARFCKMAILALLTAKMMDVAASDGVGRGMVVVENK